MPCPLRHKDNLTSHFLLILSHSFFIINWLASLCWHRRNLIWSYIFPYGSPSETSAAHRLHLYYCWMSNTATLEKYLMSTTELESDHCEIFKITTSVSFLIFLVLLRSYVNSFTSLCAGRTFGKHINLAIDLLQLCQQSWGTHRN